MNQGIYLFLVLHFLNGACLFKLARKVFLKNNQVSSTDGLRSISLQETRARSIRKTCSQKCFRELLTVMSGGRLTTDPLQTQAMRQWSLRSWLKTGVFREQVGQDIYEGARVYGFGVVPGRFIDHLCDIEGIKHRL